MNANVATALQSMSDNPMEAMGGQMTKAQARTTLAAHIAQQDATIARLREVLDNDITPAAADWKRRQVSGWRTMETIAEFLTAALNQEQGK